MTATDTAYAVLLERRLVELGAVTAIEPTGRDVQDEDGWRHNAYAVTIARLGHSAAGKLETPYRMGLALAEPVQVAEVFGSLLSDASCGLNSFEDFCSDFGYDLDSRKAYAMWEQCGEIAKKLGALFSNAELAELRELAVEL